MSAEATLSAATTPCSGADIKDAADINCTYTCAVHCIEMRLSSCSVDPGGSKLCEVVNKIWSPFLSFIDTLDIMRNRSDESFWFIIFLL